MFEIMGLLPQFHRQKARMGNSRSAYRVLREKHDLDGPGLDGRILVKWIFRKWYGRA